MCISLLFLFILSKLTFVRIIPSKPITPSLTVYDLICQKSPMNIKEFLTGDISDRCKKSYPPKISSFQKSPRHKSLSVKSLKGFKLGKNDKNNY